MAIDFKELDAILDKAPIKDVVANYLPLIPKGKIYLAKCPFHNDTNPSMQVNPERNTFKCFVCGAGGRPVTFVMRYTGMKYWDAVKEVARICHLELPKQFAQRREFVREHEQEYKCIESLEKFYSYMLKTNEGRTAMQYLEKRKLSQETIAKFGLGYAPLDVTRSVSYLRGQGKFDVKTLENAGILSNSGEFKDRYCDRIMFPLSDVKGEIVGFSGRRYREGDSTGGKYMNSPESVLFHKSDLLYNVNNALVPLRKEKAVYVVEGFMDVIALDRAGIPNAVGLMGTAMTEQHVKFFAREKAAVHLALDNDAAGQKGNVHSLEMLLNAPLDADVVVPYQGGKDVDELLDNKGADAVHAAFTRFEQPLVYLAKYFAQNHELNTYQEKNDFLIKWAPYYLKSPLLAKAEILKEVSAVLGVDASSVKAVLESRKAKGYRAPYPEPVPETRELTFEEYQKSVEDLAKEAVNLSLIKYMEPGSGSKNIKEQRLLKNECRILVRMAHYPKAREFFASKHFVFVNPVLGLANSLLENCLTMDGGGNGAAGQDSYENLKRGVEEYFLALETDEIGEKENDERAKRIRKVKHEKTDGVLMRLCYCAYPKEVSQPRDWEKAYNEHQSLVQQLEAEKNPGLDASTTENLVRAAVRNYREKEKLNGTK